jgi:hypothetical protein
LNDIDDFRVRCQVAGSCRANFQREIQAQPRETGGSAEPETIAAFAIAKTSRAEVPPCRDLIRLEPEDFG